jgi:ParB-like chromosome segregation protein Spo0J
MKNEMTATRVRIDAIKADEDNARVHDARQIDAIARSLTAFGQRRPIVLDDQGTVIAGNGTLAAAKALGWTEIDAVVAPFATPEERRAYAIADNRTGNLAEWSHEALITALRDADGETIAATGFTRAEYDQIRMELLAQANQPGDAEAHQSGYKRAASANEGYDAYLASTERNIVLEYPMPRYLALIDAWAAYRSIHGHEGNNESLLHLIAAATGGEAPR